MIAESITDKLLEIFSNKFPSDSFDEYLGLFRKEMNKRFDKMISSITTNYNIPSSILIDIKNDEKIKFEDLLNQLPRFDLNNCIPCFPTLIFNIFLSYLLEYSHLIIPSEGFEVIVSKWKKIMTEDYQQLKFRLPTDFIDSFPDYWKHPTKQIKGAGMEEETETKSEDDMTTSISEIFNETNLDLFISKLSALSNISFSEENIEEIGRNFHWRKGRKSIIGKLSECSSWSTEKIKEFEDFISNIAFLFVEENNKPSFLVDPIPYSEAENENLIGFKIYLARRIQNATSRYVYTYNQNSGSSSILKKEKLTLFVHSFFFEYYVPFYSKLIKSFYQSPSGTDFIPIYANCLDFNVGARVTRLFIQYISFKSIHLFDSFPEFTFFPFSRNARKKKSEFVERKSDQMFSRIKDSFPGINSCNDIFESIQKNELKGSGINWNKALYNIIHRSSSLVGSEAFLHLPPSIQNLSVEKGKTEFTKELQNGITEATMEEDFSDPIGGLEKGKIVLDLKLIQEKRRQEMISLLLRMGFGNTLLRFFYEEEKIDKYTDEEQLSFLNSIPYEDLEYLIQIIRFEFLSYAAIDNGNENPILKIVFENIPLDASSSHLNIKKALEIWCSKVQATKARQAMTKEEKTDFRNLTKFLLENQIIDSHLLRTLELTETES